MRPGFKQATTTTWKPKTQTSTPSNSRPLPSTPNNTTNSNQKNIQNEINNQNENKEIKETKQIDIISNKLR